MTRKGTGEACRKQENRVSIRQRLAIATITGDRHMHCTKLVTATPYYTRIAEKRVRIKPIVLRLTHWG